MADEPESLVLQLLGNMRAEMTDMRRQMATKDDISEVKSRLADVAADLNSTRRDISEQIDGLHRAVLEYHTSTIGHGILISEIEARLRRVEQHLNLEPPEAHRRCRFFDAEPTPDKVTISGASPFAGITAVSLSPAIEEELSSPENRDGVVVVVVNVAPDSHAAAVAFQEGDMILAINDGPIKATRNLPAATGSRSYYWKLSLLRAGEVIDTVLDE